jgi:hypothetical protein
MPNPNNPNGFQFVTVFRPMPPRIRKFIKVVGTTVAIFQNDVVYAAGGASGETKSPIKSFADGATPGTTLPVGVALDFGSASKRTQHHVIVDFESDFVAQDNDGTTGILGTDLNKNANVDPTGVAGSSLTGFSGNQIDKSTVNVSASRDLLLIQLWPDVNNAFGPNARVICRFNREREVPGSVGI